MLITQIANRRKTEKLIAGCLATLLILGMFLPFITPIATAQTCDLAAPSLLYTQGTFNQNPAQLFSTAPSELPTIADQLWTEPETLLKNLPEIGDSTISAVAFDRKSSVIYFAFDDSQASTDTLAAISLPFGTSTPVIITSVPDNGGTESIVSITVDYTNRDKVYFLRADEELQDYSIQSFPRLSQPVASPTLTSVRSFEGSENLKRIQHRRGTTDSNDSLLLISVNFDIPRLSEIPLNADGSGATPVVLDSDLFSSLAPPEGFRNPRSISFNPVTLDFYLVREDFSEITDRFLMKFKLDSLNTPTEVFLAPILTSQASPQPQCDVLDLAVGVAGVATNANVFLYCSPFSAGNIGIASLDQNLTLVNPIVSVNPNSFFQTHSVGAISCCNLSGDVDTDGDGLKDCADAAPLVQLDTDKDGITDQADACPSDFASATDQTLSGLPFGCPCTDTFDSDLDGLLNCQESAQTILIPAGEGCTDTADADRDGTQNCFDPCPNDPNKVLPLLCGCEIAETPDCKQTCRPGVVDLGCGCGVTDCPTPRTGEVLTRFTNIDSPPDVVIGTPNNDGERNITLMFQAFVGATRVRLGSLIRTFNLQFARRQRLSVAYDVVITKIEGNKKRNVLRRTVRANSLLVRRLESGLYTAKYRGIIRSRDVRTGEKRVAGRTSFSPSRTFSF